MIRTAVRERVVALAASIVLALLVVRQAARQRAESRRQPATVTHINTRREGTP